MIESTDLYLIFRILFHVSISISPLTFYDLVKGLKFPYQLSVSIRERTTHCTILQHIQVHLPQLLLKLILALHQTNLAIQHN